MLRPLQTFAVHDAELVGTTLFRVRAALAVASPGNSTPTPADS
ncbi:hypothetical protein ABZ626_03425 [Streptomyces longispororuber]